MEVRFWILDEPDIKRKDYGKLPTSDVVALLTEAVDTGKFVVEITDSQLNVSNKRQRVKARH